jgi:hypothetical protein
MGTHGDSKPQYPNSAVRCRGNPRASARGGCQHGHGGYTGTIAEKTSFTCIPDSEVGDTDPTEYAGQLIDEQDSRIDSKWGPAGCIHIEDGTYLFFGWASA